jgi:hypothetical protein
VSLSFTQCPFTMVNADYAHPTLNPAPPGAGRMV